MFRKVAGLGTDGVIGIFLLDHSGRTMKLRSTQSVRKMRTRDISRRLKVGLTSLPPSCADCPETVETSTSWYLNGLSRPVME